MNSIEYVRSENIWRAPEVKVESCSLGADILKKLKHSDPQKILEVHHESGTNVTVKEIRDQTITVAQNLLDLGVKKNDRVVFFTNLNLKITPLTYACYTIGAPVCFFEIHLPQEHVPAYLEILDPSVILYEEGFKSMVTEGLKGLNLTNLRYVLTLDGEQKSVDELLFAPAVDIESFEVPDIGDPRTLPALLTFTSATTGLPKIVMNSHALVRLSVVRKFDTDPETVTLILSEIRWIGPQVFMIQPGLLGIKRIYSSIPYMELTGECVRTMIDTHKVTVYSAVPRFMRSVYEAAEKSREKNPSTLSSLKIVYTGGENLGEALEKYFTKITPHCKVVKCYGMTEVAGGMATTEKISIQKYVNGGVLKNGFMIKLIDDDGNSLGPNQIGVVCIKTATPFLGYLKNDLANKESFIEGGWFNTGDIGVVDSDNLLNIFTREKHILRYADGKIIFPDTIEDIVNSFDGVHSSALIGKCSTENPKQYCGTIFVVLQDFIVNLSDFENDLRAYLRKELTKEQLKIIKYFKVIDHLPMTTCFKINRMALKKMLYGGCRIIL